MMDTAPFPSPPDAERSTLPLPTRQRWQPLRLGLVELFHYDSEEFWFRDGHLLLRGNNGTGKSKVLSLTLPFLLDAQIKSSRLEPDGDSSKKMSWNLLVGTYPRRIGYAWLEFGRRAEDGQAHYLTLGAGLFAAEGRANVEPWYFIIDDEADAPRINRDLWLTSEQRVVLTKERLRDALVGHGQVFDTARVYRRAVDERLFRLGPQRYDALMDTLIQLRQPQLSRKPDETALSNALSESLPPIAAELIVDVAEALGQLEEDRRQLEEYQALAKAVERFERRYRVYASTRSRREAGTLRSAQTEFDNASRTRNEALALLEAAQSAEVRAKSVRDEAELALKREQARLETLRDDPVNADAARLSNSQRDVEARYRSSEIANAAVEKARQRAQRDRDEVGRSARRVAEVEGRLAEWRRASAQHAGVAGIATTLGENVLATLGSTALVALSAERIDQAASGLRTLAVDRRKDIALIRQRIAETSAAEAALAQRRENRDERQDAAQAATEARERSDAAVEAQGEALVADWSDHFAGLQQLQSSAENTENALAALGDWARTLDGENPARRLLQTAQQAHSQRQAVLRAALDADRGKLELEREELEGECRRLESGVDAGPPEVYTREAGVRTARDGAPLWQLIDFREGVEARHHAGLEAALEASGLLDAWLSPDGTLQAREDGQLLLDVQVLVRRQIVTSLSQWLEASVPDGCGVPASVISRILAGIAAGEKDPGDCESWISVDGRFRFGALSGAWAKPEAAYIGYAARAAARARRLAEIAERLQQIADGLASIRSRSGQVVRDDARAQEEWRLAPAEDALRQAHADAAASAREAQNARDRLVEADLRFREAEQTLGKVRQQLASDAGDLNLPTAHDTLLEIESALHDYNDAQSQLHHVISDLRQSMPELERQRERERDALEDLMHCEEQSTVARGEADEAAARLAVLRETVGAKVEQLLQKLTAAKTAVDSGNFALKLATQALLERAEARAVAARDEQTAGRLFDQRSCERADAVVRFQRFAATGLLLAAWPEAPVPDIGGTWTIDPALTLARRTEQALVEIRHDEEAWGRVQKEIMGDYAELQRALSARGHQAQAESSDWGFIVQVVYQNRPERPDRLTVRLAEEVKQRNELLTAKEREVLENHLQAEIASEIQRLLQVADAQRNAINKELYKRPTSTGLRYRLLWQPLSEEEGAPVGFEAARKRLLNTNADLWTAEDRAVVGAMLQQRIAAERERAEESSVVGGGSLADQLGRALDYRRWHRFRVQRWQGGDWRSLSGPASSGERALGLTVPLFAAVASFYTQSNYALAPRLMLLDEAFAGIDDAARAHCMGLIREFDLDFVITSEREWACYAELPGVSICQLQRKEGIDAVYVSRWTWDGREKRREADPDRRFAPG